MNHSVNQRPTKRPAVAPGGFLDKLTRAATKLVEAYRTAEGWVTGIWDRVRRLIARQTGWTWPGSSAVDDQARSAEAAAEVATARPGHRIGLAETQRAGWHLPDPPPKPHRQRAPRSSSGQKRARGEHRKRTPGKPRQGIRERLRSSITGQFARFTAEAPEAEPSRNGSARDRGPGPAAAAATGATPGDPAPDRRRPRFDSSLDLILNIDDLFQVGFLIPGAPTHGIFCWPGGVCPVSYVADLTDPAAAWLRLWFCTTDLRTRCRRTVHQQVWLTRMPDETWQFFHKGGASRRLILRPGADRFRFPSVPGARRAGERPRERAHEKPVPAKKAARPIILHVDLLLRDDVLTPGEPRYRTWNFGDDIGSVALASDMFDPGNSRLWLHFTIPGEAGLRRPIDQEVVLRQGDKLWWFRDEGRISERLVFCGDRFQLPRPPRFPSKPPCIPPQQPARPSGADTPGAPLQEPAAPGGTDIPGTPDRDGGDGPRTNSDPAPRRGRLRSRLAEATGTARQLVARILAPLWTAAMRLMARLGIVGRSRPAV
jgi:hypothetical protein